MFKYKLAYGKPNTPGTLSKTKFLQILHVIAFMDNGQGQIQGEEGPWPPNCNISYS